MKINLPDIIGKGYGTFWNDKKRYRVIKGGRGSKKSTTTAMNYIYRLLKYPLANLLVIRQVDKDHRGSTYSQLKWACHRLGVAHLFKFNLSPLSIEVKETGQKVLFRGLNDAMSITSIVAEKGYLCWVWIEEAYQVMSEDDFNKLDMSIRGELPNGYFKQITLSFNPWFDKHWMNKRFFLSNDDNVNTYTTTYKCNEWLGSDDVKLFNDMKEKNPSRYRIEGLGEWGIAEGLVYSCFNNSMVLPHSEILKKIEKYEFREFIIGIDWGYTAFMTCSIIGVTADYKYYQICEYYETKKLPEDLFKWIQEKKKELNIDVIRYAFPDSADAGNCAKLKQSGYITHNKPSAVGGSIDTVRTVMTDGRYFISDSCKNTLMEYNIYRYPTDEERLKRSYKPDEPIKENDHCMDGCVRYPIHGFEMKYNSNRYRRGK